MHLVVVESPAKAKTIVQYLGKDYVVVASFGHVRELPSENGSVDVDHNFKMKYQIIPKSKKYVDEIIKLAQNAQSILVASDPDREGEAIAYAIYDILTSGKKKIDSNKIFRVSFTEITKSAVQEAVKNPRQIDKGLVDAQQARLALDYLVGFNLSPVLWRKLPGSRSAGRVQSVALRMIVDRELEIKQFIPQEYWSLQIDAISQDKTAVLPRVLKYNNTSFSNEYPSSQEEALKIKNDILNAKQIIVIDKESKEVKQYPYPPFITSSLQQEASKRLGFNSKRTMQVAQKLYEGVPLSGKTKALITYMRTDGVTISKDALFSIRNFISDNFKKDYLPKSPIAYKSKIKNAQEAHEAIRPIDITITPNDIKDQVESDYFKLYDLIWKRTVACQMSNAVYDRESIDFSCTSNDGKVIVSRISGSRLKFDGFLTIYNAKQNIETYDDENEEESILPELNKGDKLDVNDVYEKQHFTSPPPRYTEATLIKNLEAYGIGRPSTYASIISVLQDREYVILEKRQFVPEERGIIVATFLKSFFERYVEYDFTAKLETDLDLISDNKLARVSFLEEFWSKFKSNVDEISDVKNDKILQKLGLELNTYIKDSKHKVDDICPSCNSGKLKFNISKFGIFLGCSNYPECKFIHGLHDSSSTGNNTGNDSQNAEIFEINDNTKAIIKNGKFGRYIELTENGIKKNYGIPKNVTEITDDIIKFYISLPLKIGKSQDGNDIALGNGKFGPYVVCNKVFHSVKEKPLHEITIEDAIEIISKPKKPSRFSKTKKK